MTAAALPADADVLWRPHPGFQVRALACDAFEALIGGAAGPGKTDCLLYGGLRDIDHPATRQLFLRESYPELREVMDRALGVFRQLGAEWRESEKRWRFPSGATYEFGYCGTFAEAQRYLGQEYTGIRFDEIGKLPEERTWVFLLSRLRTTDPDLRLEARGSANPGGAGHAWLKKRFIVPCGAHGGTYTDPKTGLTRAYVPGRLADNPSISEAYRQQLRALPEVLRRAYEDGDWDAGEGLALDELDEARHLVPARAVPAHWPLFGAFDWGFAHKFCFGVFATSETGRVELLESVHGRRLKPAEIFERIRDVLALRKIAIGDIRYAVAGTDVKNAVQARGEMLPSIAEQFAGWGLPLIDATTNRVAGLNNLRNYVAWRGPTGEARAPLFVLHDTPGNRQTWACLTSMVTDPDNPEDALKVDADPMTGEGGDDPYDMVRYGLASRPLAAMPQAVHRHNPDLADRFAVRKSAAPPARPAAAAPFRMPRPAGPATARSR